MKIDKRASLYVFIPTVIFRNRKLGTLEVVVKYLREKLKMNYSEIGRLLNRNERTIWTAYHRAKKKI